MHKGSLESYRTEETIGNGYVWVLELKRPAKERIFYFSPFMGEKCLRN